MIAEHEEEDMFEGEVLFNIDADVKAEDMDGLV